MHIDADIFLKFVFSVIFFFVCGLMLMLYTHKLLGFTVQVLLRYFVLPPSTRVHLGGLFISPLNCRIFIQNLFYQDENVSLRVIDGYVSFVFWDSWWKDPEWTKVRDFMFTDDLNGKRCRVQVKLLWVRGVIVEVLRNERKLRVRLESPDDTDGATNEAPLFDILTTDDDTPDILDAERVDFDSNLTRRHMSNANSNTPITTAAAAASNNDRDAVNNSSSSDAPETRRREPSVLFGSSANQELLFSPVEGGSHASPEQATNNDATEGVPLGFTKLFDVDAVQIPQKRGKVRVHLNGMGLTLYNATWNYKNLAPAEPVDTRPRSKSLQSWAVRNIFSRIFTNNNGDNIGEEEEMQQRRSSDEETQAEAEQAKAVEQQKCLKETKTLMQRFYNFIGAVEVELYASYVDLGGAGAKHPYFLHVGFKRAEAHSYLTQDGMPSVDLYRFVTEATLEEVHASWCPMKKEKEKESKYVNVQELRRGSWRESFMLMLKGTLPNGMPSPVVDEVSSLIRNYGVLLSGKGGSSLHVVFYRDVTNVHAGEDVSRQADLPRMGFEVFVDAPELCYGPWSHFSLMKLKESFFPTTYRPLEPLKFELGKPRPLAGFEVLVEFLRDTCVTVPFKRKNPAPSPPFGIQDSGRKGMLLITLGRGTQYIQKPQFLLQGEEKQRFESLLAGKNVWLATNGIHEESTVLAHMTTMDLFIDRQDDRAYNGRKLLNVLPSLRETELWWYMDYITFFMDLITDFQFVPQMYHGEPLSTETYNTYTQFVKEFIPNVKRFEFFFNDTTWLHINANQQNVIFSEDANDATLNTLLSFCIKRDSHFFVTLPNDAYLLSASTEVRRPFETLLRDIEVTVSVPGTHPLRDLVDATKPFLLIDEFSLKGAQIVHIPNQTVPQDRFPVDPASGRTKLRNSLDLDIQLVGLRGFATTPHICTILDTHENIFGDSACVIRPDELFWPLSKIQPKLDAPKNVRQKFNTFLHKNEPRSNELEINLSLCILDMDATLRAGNQKSPQINLCCGRLEFALIRLGAATDISLSLTPISGRFLNRDGETLAEGSYLCCGDVAVSIIRHFGPLPLRTCFHSATDVMIGGVTFNITVEQVATLTQLLSAFMEQFGIRDARLVSEIEEARTAAAYSAEHFVARAPRSRAHGDKETNPNEDVPHFSQTRRCTSLLGIMPMQPESAADVREVLRRFLARDGSLQQVPFSDAVPEVMAVNFNAYLETFQQAEDMAKDYAVVTKLVLVERVTGCVAVGPDGYFELKLPSGVQMASSSMNDLNSNSRMSVAVQAVALRGFCRHESGDASHLSDDFVEVFHTETALRVRHCTAYPFEKGLESHHEKQQQFVEDNDIDSVFTGQFPHAVRTPLQASGVLEPKTAPRNARQVSIDNEMEDENRDERAPHGEEECPHEVIGNFEQQLSRLQQKNNETPNGVSAVMLSHPETFTSHSPLLDNNNNTSQRFATCLSATAVNDDDYDSEEDEEENEEPMHDEHHSSTSQLPNDAFAASISPSVDRGAPFTLAPLGDDGENSVELRPFESFTSFLRPFFLHSTAGEEQTSLRYSATAWNVQRSIRDRTCFHAQLPSTEFFSVMSPHRALEYSMAEQMLGTFKTDDSGDAEAEVWALRTADNRRRSREGSTSKHLHVEAVAPLTSLVTKDFVQKLYFDAEARFLAQVQYYRSNPPAAMSSSDDSLMRVIDSSPIVGINPNGRQNRSKKHLIRRNEPSKNRVHQKRWLSEVKIVSVILPCIEVKALTELPPPPENMTPGVTTGNGVYTTMLGVRSFQFVMQQAMPPAHAAMQLKMSALSASVTFSSLAIITQVEYEPLAREGNLRIKVPGIVYDEEKDTLAVSYLTSFCGRGKQDSTHGVESGTCRVMLDTVAFHLTRNFFHYVGSIKAMLLQLRNMRAPPQMQIFPHAPTPESMMIRHEQVDSLRDILFPSCSSSVCHAPSTSMGNFGIEANRIVQGVGSIDTLRVELVDVYREGPCMRVDTDHANLMEVTRPSAKFIAKVPIKRRSEWCPLPVSRKTSLDAPLPAVSTRDSSLLSTEWQETERRRRQHRDAEVHFIGEVNSLLVRCYPSVLQLFGAAKELKGAAMTAPTKSREEDSQQFVPTIFYDLLHTPATDTAGGGLGVVLKGSFTLHQLDVTMLHSKMNFMQFKGSKLTGYGESRTERVSSHECVETHVLTDTISDGLRGNLSKTAQRAREWAPKSCYAAQPSVTPQLHLKNSASFFAETIFLQYVADAIVLTTPCGIKACTLGASQTTVQSRVFVATATHLAVGVHQADQNNATVGETDDDEEEENVQHASKREKKNETNGVQMNLQVKMDKVDVSWPYRPQANETVAPQLHQWLREWMKSRRILQAMQHARGAPGNNGSNSVVPPTKRMHAWCCIMQIREMRIRTDMPQGISIELDVPLASAFLNASSDERLQLKSHLHPFALVSTSPSAGRHNIDLPNLYILYAKDEARRMGTCLMESVEIIVSPSIISHLLLISDRFLTAFAVLSKPVHVQDGEEGHTDVLPREPSSKISFSGWKGRFVFLLDGFRASYLTSMTNLRFSMKRLHTVADVNAIGEQRTTHFTTKASNAQIALVDRDDHDQLQSMLCQGTVPARSEASVPSTKAAPPQCPSASPGSDDSVRVVRPLGGYIWGLFETSFTLSGGQIYRNETQMAFENFLVAVPSPRATSALSELDSLNTIATRWNLSVLSPLIIARIGLLPLLQQSIDETKDLAEKMRFATQREGRLFRRQLAKSATYRSLARVRRQMDAEMQQSQLQKAGRLRELTAHVIPRGNLSLSRRVSLAPQAETIDFASLEAKFLNKTSDNKFLVTVSNFLVVMPCGDAAYRSVLEELPDVYMHGRGVSTLNRKHFIPTMALKMKVENTMVSCGLLKSKKCVPAGRSTGGNESYSTFPCTVEQDTTKKVKFTARLAMDDAYFYYSDGSPLATDASAKELLSSTHILGGRGTLTSFEPNEYHKSLSRVYFASIEAPLHLSLSGGEVNIGAAVDMSAPQITISTRFVSILSQIAQELPSKPFLHYSKRRRACAAACAAVAAQGVHAGAASTATVTPQPTKTGGERQQRHHIDPINPCGGSKSKKGPTLYHVDLTARLEHGEVRVFALQKDVTGAATTTVMTDGPTSILSRSMRRRVKLSLHPSERDTTTASVGGAAATGGLMASLLTIPFPSITALVGSKFGGGVTENEETMIRLDIRANTIEVGPSIMSLAREIEEWVVVDARDNSERVAKTLSLVREWERNLAKHNVTLHTSLADVALPLPRAFAASLAAIRSTSSITGAVRRRRRHQVEPEEHGGSNKNSFMSIHMHITGFRVVLTTEPASNVYLSLFLDERGGSIDLFIKRISERPPSWFRGSTAFIPPVVSFALSVRRLRVECQAKLEVKTLEVFLPEVEVCAAVRRRCGKWAVTSVCIHLPPETSGSAGLEMTVRAPHVSQLFIVQELWHKSLCESLQSIRQMFARGAHIIKENAKMNVIIQRRMESIRQGFSEETLLLVVTGAHGKVRLDLGSGNAQQASLGGVGLVLHLVRPVSRAWRKMCFDVAVRTLMLRSEGVLSGVASLDNVYLKAFLIENASDAAVLMRSPAGRTFREVLCMQKLHAVFKERQLKDVFECHVTEFRASCLDGVGEEDYTTVEADVFLSRSSVVVTPSTVPAFLNTITSFSDIVAAQRKITATKLLDSGAYTAQASRTRKLEDVVGRSEWTPVFRASATPNESTLSPSVTLSLNDNNVVVTSDKDDGGNSSGRDNSAEKIHAECFAFMGNALTRIPCGQIHIKLEQTTLLLGSAPTGANSAGSLIASFPMAALSFAECPSEAGTVVKKVLVLDTENMELFRPGVVKVLILGFRGVNKFEFYSRQKIGDGEVGFMLSLDQAYPWTGNPRFQDFQELIQLVRSFAVRSNTEVLHKFGRADQAWDEGQATETPSANTVADVSVDDAHAEESTEVCRTTKPMDERTLKALRNVKFSPQLRFGGDVAVNIDVILNWLGISEKMLPHILHVQMGDKMERLLSRLADKVSERVTRANDT